METKSDWEEALKKTTEDLKIGLKNQKNINIAVEIQKEVINFIKKKTDEPDKSS